MRYAVSFTVGVPTAQKAVSLRDGARDYITANGGTVTNFSSSREDAEWRVYGVRKKVDGNLAAVKGTFMAMDEADATPQALAAVPGTAVISYVERMR
jgi:hypothetical protein